MNIWAIMKKLLSILIGSYLIIYEYIVTIRCEHFMNNS